MSDTDTHPIPDDLSPGDESAQEALRRLLAVLDLSPAAAQGAPAQAAPGQGEPGQGEPDAARPEDLFVGQSQPQPWGRVFGGQVLAQSLVAAQRTVDPGRPVHSLHAYFLRAGDSREPITFSVERLRDGHSFSARRTHAMQFGRPILSMIASFQAPAQGMDHQEPMPDVPGPESLPTLAERYRGRDGRSATYWLRERPMDLRHVDPPAFLEPAPVRASRQAVWMRAVGPLPDDPALHAAVLAYASDYALLEPVLRAHGQSFSSPGLKAASLDHAMWWHRPARADEWLLFALESPSASGARGLGTGRIYTRDGLLVASLAQEGMLRVPPS